jgi:hypothetical protein
MLSIVGLIAAVVCATAMPGMVEGQSLSSSENAKSRERLFYERAARRIEPDLTGRPERLPVYLRFFQREMITDARLFPFDVEAEWTEDGRVVLGGFVGFEENRTALVKLVRCLGFERVEDRIEILPSKQLGERRFGLVKVPHTFSFDQPTGRQEVLTDCLLGSPLYLLKEASDGFFLCHSADGYVGYVGGGDVCRVDRKALAGYRGGSQLVVRRDFQSSDMLVPMGARLKHVGRRGEEIVAKLPTGEEILLPTGLCRLVEPGPNRQIEAVIENASAMLGTPYLWGGNTSAGIDCSGLMQTSFASAGINLPRDSSQQIYLGSLSATRWHRDGLRRGDTLYFLGQSGKISHTAIYLGDDQYLEAVRPAVRRASFNPQDENYDARRSAAFCFAKRLFE